jgi:molybdenum cofactor synthesis domain-containing protein
MIVGCAVVTISDSAAAGTREDHSGPALEARISALGWTVAERSLVPDNAEAISKALSALADFDAVDLILTTGGTGVSPRDVTPEAVSSIADKEIPGFGELMRMEGRKSTVYAPISRSGAYTRGTTLILTLPGSPRGAVDSLNTVAPLITHVIDLLHGRTEHVQKPSH